MFSLGAETKATEESVEMEASKVKRGERAVQKTQLTNQDRWMQSR